MTCGNNKLTNLDVGYVKNLSDESFTKLQDYLRENNIDYIDYLPIFKCSLNTFGDIDSLYLPCDGHYNEEGHNLIADELIKKLY